MKMNSLLTSASDNYFLKPVILDAKNATQNKLIEHIDDGGMKLQLENKIYNLNQDCCFDMLLPTMFGLNEALVTADEGRELRSDFENEFIKINNLYEKNGHAREYGFYVFYPDCKHMVQFAPPEWHHLSLIASNAELIKDPQFKYSWREVRDLFSNKCIAIAGASVGSKLADTILKVMRPKQIIIADPAVYKLTNANRTDITYQDIVFSAGIQREMLEQGFFSPYGMKNKATSFALKAQKIDPYLQVYPIQNGVTLGNLAEFVEPADIIVEEVDMSYDLEIKVAIRAEARRQKKLFCMMSDVGSWIQWDIRPFHINDEIPLFVDCSDEKIYELNKEAKSGKDNFFKFMEGLIGPYFWESGELGDTLAGRIPRIVGSMPQLGSTTSVAGGVGAELISRIVLGHLDVFERGIIDLRKQEIRTYGKKIGDLL